MQSKNWDAGAIIVRHSLALMGLAVAAQWLWISRTVPFGWVFAVTLIAVPAMQLGCGIVGDFRARGNPSDQIAQQLLKIALWCDSILGAIPYKPFAGMTVFNLSNMARLRLSQGCAQEAESYNRQVLRLLESTVHDSVMLQLTYKNLSMSLLEQSRAKEAEALAHEALMVMPDEKSPLGKYLAYSVLSAALNMQNRYDEALAAIRSSEELASKQRLADAKRSECAQVYRMYRSSILLQKITALRQSPAAAELVAARAEFVAGKLDSVEGVNDTTQQRSNIAFELMEAGDLEGAEDLIKAAMAVMDDPGVSERTRAFVFGNYGDWSWRTGQLAEAEAHSLRALELFTKLEGEFGHEVSWCCVDLGRIYQDKGDCAQAKSFFTRALSILANERPVNATKLAEVQRELESLN